MTGHSVKIVGDDEMPEDVEWMFVKNTDGSMILCISRSAAGCSRALAEAWAAYRRMALPLPSSVGVPVQRAGDRLSYLV